MKNIGIEKIYKFDSFKEMFEFAKKEHCWVNYKNTQELILTQEGDFYIDEYPGDEEISLIQLEGYFDENGELLDEELFTEDGFILEAFTGHEWKENGDKYVILLNVEGAMNCDRYAFDDVDKAIATAIDGMKENSEINKIEFNESEVRDALKNDLHYNFNNEEYSLAYEKIN